MTIWRYGYLINHRLDSTQLFLDLRTVDESLYDTFRLACTARGLLNDDKEYLRAVGDGGHVPDAWIYPD